MTRPSNFSESESIFSDFPYQKSIIASQTSTHFYSIQFNFFNGKKTKLATINWKNRCFTIYNPN